MSSLAADLREMLREQREYRELLVQMTRRDLLLRYKQTVMGVGWAIFMPLLNTAVFSIIFTRVAPIPTSIPYPVFAYCGLMTWNFSASSLRFGVNSLTSNAALVTKVFFPREILPLSAVLVALVDLAVASSVLVAMMAFYGIGASVALVWLPVIVLVQAAFTAGVALVLAMGNLFYRDVKYLFEVVITLWMFATSVLYPVDLVGGRLSVLLRVNPMTIIIDAYRSVLLRGESPESLPLAAVTVAALATLASAWVLFHRAEFQFAENV